MKFYDPKGQALDKQAFIKLYCADYFLNGEKLVKYLSRTSPFVEAEVMGILKAGMRTEHDVMRALAWKVGKIRHGESEAAQRFVYFNGCLDCEKTLQMRVYRWTVDASELVRYILSNIDELEETVLKAPWTVFERLAGIPCCGIGSVYLLTLLFFLSKGRRPIYDRFAGIALDAILTEAKPGTVLPQPTPPDKQNVSRVAAFFDNGYQRNLIEVFGEDFWKERDVDRALWVYGHLFTKRR